MKLEMMSTQVSLDCCRPVGSALCKMSPLHCYLRHEMIVSHQLPPYFLLISPSNNTDLWDHVQLKIEYLITSSLFLIIDIFPVLLTAVLSSYALQGKWISSLLEGET